MGTMLNRLDKLNSRMRIFDGEYYGIPHIDDEEQLQQQQQQQKRKEEEVVVETDMQPKKKNNECSKKKVDQTNVQVVCNL